MARAAADVERGREVPWWCRGGPRGDAMGWEDMVDILGKTWWIHGGYMDKWWTSWGNRGFSTCCGWMMWLDFVDVSLFHPVGASNEMGRRLSTPTSTTWPRS